MSISSPSNDIPAKAGAPKNSSIAAVSGAESTAAAVAILLQAQTASGNPQTNSNISYPTHHISPSSPSSMAIDCSVPAAPAEHVPAAPSITGPQNATTNSLLQDLALQQHMLQVKQQQMIQRQILEQQFQRNREILQVEHERQLSLLLQQVRNIY